MSLSLSSLSPSLSSCLCSVSVCSPLLCCTSPRPPVFCSFGLFSLSISHFASCVLPPPSIHPSIRPSLLSSTPPSVADWSRVCASGRVQAELSQHLTPEQSRLAERHNAQREKQLLFTRPPSSCSSPPVSLASARS